MKQLERSEALRLLATTELSERAIARRLGVAVSTVQRWRAEAGLRRPPAAPASAAAPRAAPPWRGHVRPAPPPAPVPGRRAEPEWAEVLLPTGGGLPAGLPEGSLKVFGGLYRTPEGEIVPPPWAPRGGPS